MSNARKIAAQILLNIEKNNSYSNLALNSYFKELDITAQDKAFVTTLVYGVIERKITLDYTLKKFIKTPLKKVQPFTLTNLRIALYQIMFLTKIPESAAVNEAVNIVKSSKESRNAGFVNGVLRSALRSDLYLPNGDDINSLSVKYSCPTEVIDSFINDYGLENTKLLLNESVKPAPLTVRVNTLKTDISSFLENIGVNATEHKPLGAVILEKGIDISANELYKKGQFFVQDSASQTAVTVLDPKPNERMLDMCSAPGGKAFSSAILMENKGELVACDLYPHKTDLIEKSAKRLGLSSIKTKICDATHYNTDLGKFDCVLCDVPCSGLGIIRRKPEIKYKNFKEFENLPQIQYEILNNAKKYLKKGGRLLFSTCTLRKAENEEIVERFLKENPDFSLKYMHTFMPFNDGTDGFFAALLVN
ncbi:MAG: 16S rRNA (cytosine(967)-C(5))-methyltransferase RsmB [Clostridia bacterium]|nr:16S rRNA (cytosine(967)-C(5))-methyltransferase RsmB [Clostridia bacterium]